MFDLAWETAQLALDLVAQGFVVVSLSTGGTAGGCARGVDRDHAGERPPIAGAEVDGHAPRSRRVAAAEAPAMITAVDTSVLVAIAKGEAEA